MVRRFAPLPVPAPVHACIAIARSDDDTEHDNISAQMSADLDVGRVLAAIEAGPAPVNSFPGDPASVERGRPLTRRTT